MSRVKISEFQAKSILLPDYHGLSATAATTAKKIEDVFPQQNLVVKVDQGIKKRGKQGLVKVNVTPQEIPAIITTWFKLGWTSFLIEPVIEHASDAEHYLAIERAREGWQLSYSPKGGIEGESSWDQVKTYLYPDPSLPKAVSQFIESSLPIMEKNHLVFLEMNPILARGESVIPLDMAAEVDSAGTTLAAIPDRTISESEQAVAVLDASTPASLKFKLINPEGHIWMLLSGGGASLVLADEVADQGMGKELANYGEYSGAPTDDDVYAYTKIILSQLLLNQDTKPKALVIAAGIANFTDVAKTFKGIIRALSEVKSELKESKIKVFVRRGGPNEAKGLQMMTDFLSSAGIPSVIHHHETPITQVITEVKEYI
jgi:ATP citrate (pro-S)-lyase